MVAPLAKAGRKVRAPKAGVADNIRRLHESEDRIRATVTMSTVLFGGSETSNLHVEQGQIREELLPAKAKKGARALTRLHSRVGR